MSDQRQDDETLGRALGRAVETQSVRETPFTRSRVASRLDRPARGGWLGTLAIAAALGLFVAMGAFFVRGPFGVAGPDRSASPDPTARPTLDASSTAAATATPPSTEPAVVYFARDLLPPIGSEVSVPAPFRTLTPAERISARVRALWDARAPVAGTGNVFGPHVGGTSLARVVTTISGDTATVVIDAGSWDSLSSAETGALAQQLVYTITEEPGIRRATVREPGRDHAVVGTGIWKDPRSREDVFGYSVRAIGEIAAGDGTLAAEVTDWRASVDDVAPGLGRFVVELKPAREVPQGFIPRLTARLESGRNANDQEPGKYVLRLELPDASWPQTPGQAFHCCPLKAVNRTPIRQIAAYPLGTGGGRPGVGFAVELDDSRPWRLTVLHAPLRVVVDVGGHPEATVANTVVHSPQPGATVARDFRVSGLARAFEANVSWRLRDQAGGEVLRGFTTATQGSSAVWGTYEFRVQVPATVSGNLTLEVYQASARDGSDTEKVSVRLQVR